MLRLLITSLLLISSCNHITCGSRGRICNWALAAPAFGAMGAIWAADTRKHDRWLEQASSNQSRCTDRPIYDLYGNFLYNEELCD